MMTRDMTRTAGMRAALAALVLAAGVTVWTLARAIRVQTVPDTPAQTLASLETVARRMPRVPANIQQAVENDLFSPDRSAPDTPYRMPGEARADEAPKPEPAKPVVLGTAVATDGRSFATVQLGGDRPMLVHVGDKIGEWTVRAITRGKLTLVTADGTRAEITVPRPGP
jgi:hypothetical protein